MTWFQMESEVNDMSPKNDFSDIFDDDFEVTYEEDPEINFHTSEDTEQINRPDSNTETIVMNADDYRDNFNDSDDSQFEEVLPEYDDDYEDDDADYEDDYYEDDYNTPNKRSNRNNPYNDRDYDRRSSGRKRSGGGVKLAAPIKKGGKALSRFTSTLLQQPFYCVNSGHNSICTLQLLPCKHTVRRYPGGNPDTEDFPDSGRLLMCSCPLPVLRIHLPSLVNDTRPRT